jgi:hypothetical protein
MADEGKANELHIFLDMGDVLDQDQLQELTHQLKAEIEDQDVETVGFLSGDEIPEGAKSAEAITWGALAVAVLPNFLSSMVTFLQSWTMRGENRKVRIKSQTGDNSIELEYSPTTMSNEELKELISVLNSSMQTKNDE